MDCPVVENEDDQMECDSLSEDSAPKDCTMNGDQKEDSTTVNRRGSYTLEKSPEMIRAIKKRHLTQRYPQPKSSESTSKSSSEKVPKGSMSQSLYERSPSHVSHKRSILSALAKQREEKLKYTKEEQEKVQKQRMSILNESEKLAEIVRRRKEAEFMRRVDDNKRRSIERQKIVDERRSRLNKAEEARRNMLLRKLVNHNDKKPSPQVSDMRMTMSCYGGFDGGTRSRPGNKEVVGNRFLSSRPVSSTGKVIGFGSSTPRPICENIFKPITENKRIRESILARCEQLSRPSSSRIADNMTVSVMGPQVLTSAPRKPQRQASLQEKPTTKRPPRQSAMTTSVIITSPPITKTRPTTLTKPLLKSDSTTKVQPTLAPQGTKKYVVSKRSPIQEKRSSSSSSNKTKISDDNIPGRKPPQLKSATLPRNTSRTKVDSHLDSDSIDEEATVAVTKTTKTPQSIMAKSMHSGHGGHGSHSNTDTKPKVKIIEQAQIITTKEVNDPSETGRAPPTKDLSESEYKTRLMENRRLVREKRERERDELMKKEREKRHADELAAREMMEIDRDKKHYVEETTFTTSNDDTLEIGSESRESVRDTREYEQSHLSEIPEVPVITCEAPMDNASVSDDAKNDRKKKLESIMSRVRKVNDESSSEGGVSPRRAMSPEPAELEAETNQVVPVPAFRSPLLQSMMNKGRLAKSPTSTSVKDMKEDRDVEDKPTVNAPTTNAFLTSVRESVEDSGSPPSSHSMPDEPPLQDDKTGSMPECGINEDIHDTNDSSVFDVVREDCDGKEDSVSLDENHEGIEKHKMHLLQSTKKPMASSSISSAETEEEEIMKAPFQVDSVCSPTKINSVVKEGCVSTN